MTRTHRSLHRIVWPILALLVVLGVVLALWLRPPPEHARAIPHWMIAWDVLQGARAPSPPEGGEGAQAQEQAA